MLTDLLALVLNNFSLAMFVVAIVFILIQNTMRHYSVSRYEITFRWMAFFALGITSLYAFYMHTFYPEIAANAIGWAPSPFQFEVGMADLAFGVLGVLCYSANYSFRVATVVGTLCWLWGDAIGHAYQMFTNQNFSVGNAGSWFWMDILIPLVLLICLPKVKPAPRYV